MPSRIRIGPDGGPYVIVEENNGDLDITTPDNTIDLQNSGLINAALSGVLDAQNNDISNVGALTADLVSTGSIDVENGFSRYVDLLFNGPFGGFQSANSATVDTTETVILQLANQDRTGIVAVSGSSDNEWFGDIVHFGRFGSPSTISALDTAGAANRTYSRDPVNMTLSMSSGTYDVSVNSIFAVSDA